MTKRKSSVLLKSGSFCYFLMHFTFKRMLTIHILGTLGYKLGKLFKWQLKTEPAIARLFNDSKASKKEGDIRVVCHRFVFFIFFFLYLSHLS